jgi:hypothetical protein
MMALHSQLTRLTTLVTQQLQVQSCESDSHGGSSSSADEKELLMQVLPLLLAMTEVLQ